MRIPTRRDEKLINHKKDNLITQTKFDNLKFKLQKLKSKLPESISEVQRLSLLGDFSENAEYQIAKGRLRGLNQRILQIEDQINHAEIITTNNDCSVVKVGHFVTVEFNNQTKTFQILGSSETNPDLGVISRNSPLGLALLGKGVGDVVEIKLANKAVEYKIVKIV